MNSNLVEILNSLAYQDLVKDPANPRLREAKKLAEEISQSGGVRYSVLGLLANKVVMMESGKTDEITPAFKTLRRMHRHATTKKKEVKCK